ncbi:hypothetical protein AB6A40_007587 [Gnathostoma spinigerum]|uniref:DUF7808 domain-containing protein n=1 Tax=Gnathostoma spinigerum TaxID=75299 RepID=A0ABD6EUZ8_9BILA
MNTAIFLVTAFTAIFIHCEALAFPKKPYYWTVNHLECRAIAGHDVARCSLRVQGSDLEMNPGCHEELDKRNNTRVYCGIMCEESDDTTVVTKRPAWNHACNLFYNYQLQRLREDWYIWRSGECLNTTITFDVRCGFSRDRRIFYRDNAKLFEYEDATDSDGSKVRRN